MRFRQRSVEVDAIQYTGDNLEEIVLLAGPNNFYELNSDEREHDSARAALFDEAHDQWMAVSINDWIVRCDGIVVVMSPHRFNKMFERMP